MTCSLIISSWAAPNSQYTTLSRKRVMNCSTVLFTCLKVALNNDRSLGTFSTGENGVSNVHVASNTVSFSFHALVTYNIYLVLHKLQNAVVMLSVVLGNSFLSPDWIGGNQATIPPIEFPHLASNFCIPPISRAFILNKDWLQISLDLFTSPIYVVFS